VSNYKIIEIIENDLLNLKREGTQSLEVDKLLAYLADLKENHEIRLEAHTDLARYAHERNIEHYKATNQMKIALYNSLSQSASDSVKHVMEAGLSAIKGGVFINGGAAIALLTFLSDI